MRTLPILLVALLVTGALLPAPETAHADGDDDPAAIFRDRCASCHAIPDPALHTDLAWLDQVNRTS